MTQVTTEYYGGKTKAVSFSYDDGVTQDIRLIEILDYYGLKATFNLNSELLGNSNSLIRGGVTVNHTKVKQEEVHRIYKNHEVAVHTLTHPNLTQIPEEEIIRQVEQDRLNLEKLMDRKVVGMAYPCGGINNNEQVAGVIRQHTKIQYARTITSTHRFDLQNNLHQFHPTVYHIMESEQLFRLGKEFIELETDSPKLFYIWGHSYEFDIRDTWKEFENFCKMISQKKDIFYGTNQEVLIP
jgi:peptidoglycan/xylan/chitin deacetylase (PgdA/CDA1 family)